MSVFAQFETGIEFLRPVYSSVLEIERHLAGHGEQLSLHAAGECKPALETDRLAVHALGVEYGEQCVLENGCEHAFGSDKREILAFAKREKTRNLIDFGAGENHGSDGAVAHAGTRLQLRRRANLRGQVGRAVDENPVGTVTG